MDKILAYETKANQRSKKAYKYYKASVSKRVGSLPEQKYLDVSYNVLCPNSGLVTAPLLMNGIAEGSDAFQRVGRKITMTSVSYKFVLNNTVANLNANTFTVGSDTVRFLIVYDAASGGLVPSISQIMDVAGNGTDPFQHKNVDEIDRFTILVDETHNINVGGPTACAFNGYRKVNLPTRYTGTSGATTVTQTGALWLVWYGTFPGTTGASSMIGTTRVKYTDD